MELIFLSAEVLLAYLLKYFPIKRGVSSKEVLGFCESIRKQIIGLNKGYSLYIENDRDSLYSMVMNRPSQYEFFMDEYRLRCRVDVEMINAMIPKDVQKILETTAKQWAKNIGF